MTEKSFEVNFDGLVGPTHNYSGLSPGNIASTHNKAFISSPLKAVIQGLDKMKSLSDLGIRQAVLPPHERPYIPLLRQLGFMGSDREVFEKAAKESEALIPLVSSASNMWTANAATVSPSTDTCDGKVHLTAANLINRFHRSLEPPFTSKILQAIFKDPKFFSHHSPLPPSQDFGDEGAANHTRLCAEYGQKGVEFFVYGREAFRPESAAPKKFPARQTLEASSAIARLHGLDPGAVVYGQQAPDAIDAGVFHNDVVGVGNKGVYFYHEKAYLNSDQVTSELERKFEETCGRKLRLVRVPSSEVTLKDAIGSYLFNSQLVTAPGLSPGDDQTTLILPIECRENQAVARFLEALLTDPQQPIRNAIYFDLKQSMSNGGGPACLRLRVVLTDSEFGALHPGVILTDMLYSQLISWAKKHYRDRIGPGDLGDPKLLEESQSALDELTSILGLGSVYYFQR